MITKLYFKNFKSWAQGDFEFSNVTGLFGANSSGKSSIIQFLLMLKQTKENSDRSLDIDFGDERSLVDLGSFQNIISEHELSRELSWKIAWKTPDQMKIMDPEGKRQETLFEGDLIELAANVVFKGSAPSCDHLKYKFGGVEFELRKKSKPTEFALKFLAEDSESAFQFRRNPGRVWTLPKPVKSYAFPDQAKTYFQNSGFLGQFEHAYESFIDRIFYLGPLREYPRRQYGWAGRRPIDVGQKGERVIEAILAARASGETQNLMHRGKLLQLDEIVAYWLKELGLISEFRVREIAAGANLYEVLVKKNSGSPETPITDVGFGVSQVLPVITLLYYVQEGSTVLLEQPEIHLHPAVQSGLADIFIHVAKRRNVQVICESHSEHLLRRLQRRVAEESLSQENVVIYFCENVRGESQREQLAINIFGEIENWPKEFFGDEFGELAVMAKARYRRMVADAE